MVLLAFWVLLALVLSHICSLLEGTLLSVRTSALLERRTAGSSGAARLLDIKQNRLDDAISAILILNTLADVGGATFVGAQVTRLFGEAWIGAASAVLTVLLLVFSKIIPKTLAARYGGRLSGFAGNGLHYLMRVTAPVLFFTRALIRLLARRPGERFTRREFALLVGAAPQDGAISLAESLLIGSLIYSREVQLQDVMTPRAVVFMLDASQTVADLIAAPGADAFSRIPICDGDAKRVTGYVSHREVLKVYAGSRDGTMPLALFRRDLPRFCETVQVAEAFEQILARREAIAMVADGDGDFVGLITVEDMLEAILGIEITDESEAVADLRPAVAKSRKHRAAHLRRKRMQPSGGPREPRHGKE